MISCPLCNAHDCALWYRQKRKPLTGTPYHRCNDCKLIFVPSEQQLSAEDEEEIYAQHENNPNDQGYRKFLSRTFEPVMKHIRNDAHGLDFGCGPGPTLPLMFQEVGIRCDAYDPFFANKPELLERTYDFITATEVFEHLSNPQKELTLICNMLKPGGLLAIMTKRPNDLSAFKTWHYPMDPTHITFYSLDTFDWIARAFSFSRVYTGDDVVILKKISD